MLIRAMTEDDLDRVLVLENAIFANPWRRSFFKSDVGRPQGQCLVAEVDGEVVGYCVAWGSEEVHLANLAVDPDFRGEGIAGQLLDRVVDFARRRNAVSIYLEVRPSNTTARQFYSKRGFVPTYLRKSYYENGEDAIVMEWEVTEE